MESNHIISIGLPISLVIIMIGIGMTLTLNDFRQITRKPKGLILGSVSQIVGMPIIAVVLAKVFDLSPEMAVGLVIIAACPGGTASNLFVLLSRGNVALSIMLTVIASLITIATLPLATGYAMSLFSTSSVNIELPVEKMVAMMVGVVLIPVMVGMILRTFWPRWAIKAEKGVSKLGGITLVLLVASILYDIGGNLLQLIIQAGAAAISLNIIGVALGIFTAKYCRLPKEDGLTIGVELGVKNSTLALMVSMTILSSETMSIPIIVYSVSMFICAFVITVFGRRSKASSITSANMV
ncbi:bile acid:sodium symporter family protein [Shewanella acanthi]|uniref:bile acid:sodium symporter family protein n=1 Tax=Shewanella acanthi TaxID=2864212 RepID=UPI001C658439|nr:bile acid:sodium symporter family protein [Shewanella acanthi]QYJ78998.1 bile acid:sodium symporter family protein [Shewanella acanthi]